MLNRVAAALLGVLSVIAACGALDAQGSIAFNFASYLLEPACPVLDSTLIDRGSESAAKHLSNLRVYRGCAPAGFLWFLCVSMGSGAVGLSLGGRVEYSLCRVSAFSARWAAVRSTAALRRAASSARVSSRGICAVSACSTRVAASVSAALLHWEASSRAAETGVSYSLGGRIGYGVGLTGAVLPAVFAVRHMAHWQTEGYFPNFVHATDYVYLSGTAVPLALLLVPAVRHVRLSMPSIAAMMNRLREIDRRL